MSPWLDPLSSQFSSPSHLIPPFPLLAYCVLSKPLPGPCLYHGTFLETPRYWVNHMFSLGHVCHPFKLYSHIPSIVWIFPQLDWECLIFVFSALSLISISYIKKALLNDLKSNWSDYTLLATEKKEQSIPQKTRQ